MSPVDFHIYVEIVLPLVLLAWWCRYRRNSGYPGYLPYTPRFSEQKKACCPGCRNAEQKRAVLLPDYAKCAKVRTKKENCLFRDFRDLKKPAAYPSFSESLKRLRGSRSEPWVGRSGGLDVTLLQKVTQKRMPAELR